MSCFPVKLVLDADEVAMVSRLIKLLIMNSEACLKKAAKYGDGGNWILIFKAELRGCLM